MNTYSIPVEVINEKKRLSHKLIWGTEENKKKCLREETAAEHARRNLISDWLEIKKKIKHLSIIFAIRNSNGAADILAKNARGRNVLDNFIFWNRPPGYHIDVLQIECNGGTMERYVNISRGLVISTAVIGEKKKEVSKELDVKVHHVADTTEITQEAIEDETGAGETHRCNANPESGG
ncbi:hypothetical protein ACH5RR_025861 [Cinchona calisaya]|uniref:RNase H type-1 domain-containing protein n=1 Tax=Cinchona calisaya TaxID=153742 RepID=A0ABD2Z359_9GENT